LRRASGSGGLKATVGGRTFVGKMFVEIVAVSIPCLIGLTAGDRGDGLSIVVSALEGGCSSTLLIDDTTLEGRDEYLGRFDSCARPLLSQTV
jgi:hypothetical protein